MNEKITCVKMCIMRRKRRRLMVAYLWSRQGWRVRTDSTASVGDPIVIHIDDVEYYRLPVNQGYEGNINVRQIPEDFKITVLENIKIQTVC